MSLWADVVARPTGALVTLDGDGSTATLAGVTVPFPAVHTRCTATTARAVAMGQNASLDYATFINDLGVTRTIADVLHGVSACGLYAIGETQIVAQWVAQGGASLATITLNPDTLATLSALTYQPLQPSLVGTSQGLLDVNPVIYTDPNRIQTINLIRYTLPLRRGDWTIGQGQDLGGVLAYHHPTARHYRVTTYDTQLQPRIAVRPDGTAVAAISGLSPSSFIESTAWTPLAPPAPQSGINPAVYPRSMFFAPYKSYTVQYGATPNFVGNTYYIEQEDHVFLPQLPATSPGTGPFIQDTEAPGGVDLAYLAQTTAVLYYGAGTVASNQTAYEAVLNDVALAAKPIIFYLDNRNWVTPIPAWIDQSRTYLSFPCYRNVGESLAAFTAAMEALFVTCGDMATFPQVLTPQFYDRNFQMPMTEVLECMPLFDTWIRRYWIVGIMPFSDRRPSGMITYPILREYAREMYNKIPGVIPIPGDTTGGGGGTGGTLTPLPFVQRPSLPDPSYSIQRPRPRRRLP